MCKGLATFQVLRDGVPNRSIRTLRRLENTFERFERTSRRDRLESKEFKKFKTFLDPPRSIKLLKNC